MPAQPKTEDLEAALQKNRAIRTILDRAPDLRMKNWYLGGTCVAQTVWNELHGFPPMANIKDYDLIYFDDSDISYQSEDSFIAKGASIFKELGVQVEIRNQARVHLWYPAHFACSIRPYLSAEEAISTWPTTVASMGVRTDRAGRLLLYAPYGLSDLFAMIVRPNRYMVGQMVGQGKEKAARRIYIEKVSRWITLWPKLRVIPWEVEMSLARDSRAE